MRRDLSRVAVFLDRDGTINEEMGYINHLSRLMLLPGAAAGIARLNRAGVKVLVVTNQSGVARGYFPATLVEQVHARLQDLLAAGGARLDGIYVCLHGPQEGCSCRKPRPGLLTQAAAEHGLDLGRCYLVGDRYNDLLTAAAVGAAGILVLTGYGRGELELYGDTWEVTPRWVAADLEEAACFILGDLGLDPAP
jgi:D-glycero-D-manno-heptose 1,7-bisphosphate phosphatase